jgi:hypothetical protein
MCCGRSGNRRRTVSKIAGRRRFKLISKLFNCLLLTVDPTWDKKLTEFFYDNLSIKLLLPQGICRCYELEWRSPKNILVTVCSKNCWNLEVCGHTYQTPFQLLLLQRVTEPENRITDVSRDLRLRHWVTLTCSGGERRCCNSLPCNWLYTVQWRQCLYSV